jgi:hypothetical protein
MPIGSITRGTTNPNRLRRVDRWAQTWPGLRSTPQPLVVDLGYGAKAITPVEFVERIRKVRPDAQLIGFEIDPDRVASAREELAAWTAAGRPIAGVTFELGGFETPLAAGQKATIIRAFNVLRQYDEVDVLPAWHRMVAALSPEGVLIEGTCDEIGRVSTWVAITGAGPQSLSLSLKLDGLDEPSIAAERLPKILIHRNVAGENIHRFMLELDRAWKTQAPLSSFGASQRWVATVETMKASGWPVQGGRTRWRLGEITVDWEAVAPNGFSWN